MKNLHIFYSGMVQGVGFRYTVHSYANQLGLMGWVRNLPDRSVEMMVEGEEDTIKKLCHNIEKDFDGYIRQKEEHWADVSGEFKNFIIR